MQGYDLTLGENSLPQVSSMQAAELQEGLAGSGLTNSQNNPL